MRDGISHLVGTTVGFPLMAAESADVVDGIPKEVGTFGCPCTGLWPPKMNTVAASMRLTFDIIISQTKISRPNESVFI
jgi:hypothetical protein